MVEYGVGDAEYLPVEGSERSVVLRLGGQWLGLDDPDQGWIVTKVDPGTPVPRDATYEYPGDDGTVDTTSLVGGRNIIIGLSLVGANNQARLDLLAPYLNQRARPTLEVATVYGEPRRSLTVRRTDFDHSWERPGRLNVTVGFRSVGSPYWRGEERMATAWPDEQVPGAAFPLSFPITFPDATGIGAASVTNSGTVEVPWVARIFGPVTAPELILGATGERVAFKSSLTVAPGDYLTVDSFNKTALLNGLPGSPRYSHLDFPATDWFRLPVGVSTLNLNGTGTSTSTQAEISWRDAWL